MEADPRSKALKTMGRTQPARSSGMWSTSNGQILNPPKKMTATFHTTRQQVTHGKSHVSASVPSNPSSAGTSGAGDGKTFVVMPKALPSKYHKSVNTFIAGTFTSNNVVLRREYQRKFIIHRHRLGNVEMRHRTFTYNPLADMPARLLHNRTVSNPAKLERERYIARANQALVERLERVYTAESHTLALASASTHSSASSRHSGLRISSASPSINSSSASGGANANRVQSATRSGHARTRTLRAEAIDVTNYHLATRLLNITGKYSNDELVKAFKLHDAYVKRLSKWRGMRFSIDLSGDISTPEAARATRVIQMKRHERRLEEDFLKQTYELQDRLHALLRQREADVSRLTESKRTRDYYERLADGRATLDDEYGRGRGSDGLLEGPEADGDDGGSIRGGLYDDDGESGELEGEMDEDGEWIDDEQEYGAIDEEEDEDFDEEDYGDEVGEGEGVGVGEGESGHRRGGKGARRRFYNSRDREMLRDYRAEVREINRWDPSQSMSAEPGTREDERSDTGGGRFGGEKPRRGARHATSNSRGGGGGGSTRADESDDSGEDENSAGSGDVTNGHPQGNRARGAGSKRNTDQHVSADGNNALAGTAMRRTDRKLDWQAKLDDLNSSIVVLPMRLSRAGPLSQSAYVNVNRVMSAAVEPEGKVPAPKPFAPVMESLYAKVAPSKTVAATHHQHQHQQHHEHQQQQQHQQQQHHHEQQQLLHHLPRQHLQPSAAPLASTTFSPSSASSSSHGHLKRPATASVLASSRHHTAPAFTAPAFTASAAIAAVGPSGAAGATASASTTLGAESRGLGNYRIGDGAGIAPSSLSGTRPSTAPRPPPGNATVSNSAGNRSSSTSMSTSTSSPSSSTASLSGFSAPPSTHQRARQQSAYTGQASNNISTTAGSGQHGFARASNVASSLASSSSSSRYNSTRTTTSSAGSFSDGLSLGDGDDGLRGGLGGGGGHYGYSHHHTRGHGYYSSDVKVHGDATFAFASAGDGDGVVDDSGADGAAGTGSGVGNVNYMKSEELPQELSHVAHRVAAGRGSVIPHAFTMTRPRTAHTVASGSRLPAAAGAGTNGGASAEGVDGAGTTDDARSYAIRRRVVWDGDLQGQQQPSIDAQTRALQQHRHHEPPQPQGQGPSQPSSSHGNTTSGNLRMKLGNVVIKERPSGRLVFE